MQTQSAGGDKRDRTVDLLLAKQALSQLSYTPVLAAFSGTRFFTVCHRLKIQLASVGVDEVDKTFKIKQRLMFPYL